MAKKASIKVVDQARSKQVSEAGAGLQAAQAAVMGETVVNWRSMPHYVSPAHL